MIDFIIQVPRQVLILIIRIYQKTLSPDHGILKIFFRYGVCKYTPTCSEYACEALKQYGAVKGGAMSVWRVLRCNPFSKGGHDPVNNKSDDQKGVNQCD